MTPDSKGFIEKELARQAADRDFDDDTFQLWNQMGYTHKAICHHSKVFAVWRQLMGEPVIYDGWSVRGVFCATRSGFSAKLMNRQDEVQWIGHHPAKVFGEPIFAHIPFMPEISFMPRDGDTDKNMILRFPIVFKMLSNPKIEPREGHLYCTQVGEFRNTYPKFADLIL